VPGATLIRPDDPEALYTWRRWDELEEPEATDLQSFALSIYAGPSNFAEWYFPTRLQLDLAAAGDLAPIPEGDWRRQYGLRLDAVGAADMPVFAIGAERGLVTDTAAWDAWVAKLPATTRAGATRAQPEGYTALIAPGQAHLDVVNAHNQGDLDHSLAPLLRWAQGITQGQTFPLDAP
jgi:hypothetical protein